MKIPSVRAVIKRAHSITLRCSNKYTGWSAGGFRAGCGVGQRDLELGERGGSGGIKAVLIRWNRARQSKGKKREREKKLIDAGGSGSGCQQQHYCVGVVVDLDKS